MMDSLAQKFDKSFKESREFKDCYLEHCASHNVAQPSKKLALQTDPTKLRVDADQMRLTDWEAVFACLQKENQLKELSLVSTKRKRDWPCNVAEDVTTAFAASAAKGRPVVFTRYVLDKLIFSLVKSLARKESQCENLHIELPLSPAYCLRLSCGIAAAKSLSRLSLSGSCIGDEGCRFVCDAVKVMHTIRELDLSECNLSSQAIDKIVELLESHTLFLSTIAWESSFRYRAPSEEVKMGLQRLTLNKNQGIGDEGAQKLAATLVDNNYLLAVDLQKCQISTPGAIQLLSTLDRNRNLRIIDLRGNKVADYIMNSIKKALLSPERIGTTKANLKWLPMTLSSIAEAKENC